MKVVIVNNIPTPYRSFSFNTFAETGRRFGVDVRVHFQGRREKRRDWDPDQLIVRCSHSFAVDCGFRRGRPREFFEAWKVDLVLHELVRNASADVFLLSPFMGISNFVLGLKFRERRARFVLWSESNLESSRFVSRAACFVKALGTRAFCAVATPGERADAYLERVSPRLAELPRVRLPNLVDPAKFATRVDESREGGMRGRVRDRLGLRKDALLGLAIGQLIPKKGMDILIRAIARSCAPCSYCIVGDGLGRESLHDLITQLGLQDRVFLVGSVQEEEVLKLLAAADFLVHPARFDPSPLTTIEAIYAGLPIIVTEETGNAPEVVEDTKNGFLVRAEDVGGLANALDRLVGKPAMERGRMGRASRSIAETRFEPRKVSENLFQFLGSLM